MTRIIEDCLEFLLRTVGGVFILCLLIVLIFLALFWPRGETEPLPWLGIVGKDIDQTVAQQNRLPFNRGVLLEKVFANSPADYANLAPGDFVVKYNNNIVLGQEQLRNLIFEMDPEEKVWMTVYRDGTYYNVMLRLAGRPNDRSLPGQAVAFTQTAAAATAPPITADAVLPHSYRGVCSNCHAIVSKRQASQPNTQLVAALRRQQAAANTAPGQQSAPTAGAWQQFPGQGLPGAQRLTPLEEFTWAGLSLESLTPGGAAGAGLATNATGVSVDEVLVGSRGEKGDIQARDVIREINGYSVGDVDSFANIVQGQRLTGGVLLVVRNGGSHYITVPEF